MNEHTRAAPNKPDRVLLIIIASSPTQLDDIITVLLDLGLPGATVIESKGLGAILRQEMPIFAGLASLIPDQTGSRLILSVTRPDAAASFFDFLEHEMTGATKPIAFTLPIDRVSGVTR
ncbi:MAG: hypothetical protein KF684_09970 [Phycisphaeraceae bacterium]|nr:hypothetical protein [Phycisphaeraceae bacterium]